MIESILQVLVNTGKIVMIKDGNTRWNDYIFNHGGKYWVYNTQFSPDDVEKITITQNHLVIELK